MTPDQKKLFISVCAVLMFIAGFALADNLFFGGETMPEAIKPFAGFLVCGGAGAFFASLFLKQNKV